EGVLVALKGLDVVDREVLLAIGRRDEPSLAIAIRELEGGEAVADGGLHVILPIGMANAGNPFQSLNPRVARDRAFAEDGERVSVDVLRRVEEPANRVKQVDVAVDVLRKGGRDIDGRPLEAGLRETLLLVSGG